MINTRRKKPLFGMTLLEIDKNKFLICSPNIHNFREEAYHCHVYDSVGKKRETDIGYVDVNFDNTYKFSSNYGITIAFISNEIDKAIILGDKNYYRDPEYLKDGVLTSVIQTHMTQEYTAISTAENNIASYAILCNPANNEEIYLIIPYYLSNNLLGSFEVKKKKTQETQQYVKIIDGSPGQYFGFSGTLGNFNLDNCIDFAFSAPFYSKYMDEGMVYVFFCNPDDNTYYVQPMILQGDNEPYAQFGISVAEIGKRHDNEIQNIAVLASYWYKKNPVIYVYGSTTENLNSEYSHKILLTSNSDTSFLLSYGLLSHFSISNTKYSDLLVQFPFSNEIKAVSALELKKIDIKLSSSPLHEIPTPIKQCFTIDGSNKCYFSSKYNLKSCVTITPFDELERGTNDDIKLKLSVQDIPGATISSEIIQKEIEHVSKVSKEICYQNEIFFLYSSISAPPLVIKAQASINHKIYTICQGFCSESEEAKLNYQISDPFSKCLSIDCGSNLKILDHVLNEKFQQGLVSNAKLQLSFINNGPLISYALKLDIRCPIWVDVSSVKFTKMNSSISKYIEINEDNQIIHFFIDHVTGVREKIEAEIDLEIRAPLATDSIQLGISIFDPMYRFKEVHETVITIYSDGVIPLVISGSSLPTKISIEKDKTKTNQMYLEYIIELENTALTEPMNNVMMEIKVSDSYKTVEILNMKNFNFPNDFNKIECKNSAEKKCSESTHLLTSEYLLPQSSRKFYLIYEIQDVLSELFKIKLEKLEVKSEVCFYVDSTKICKYLDIHTNLNYLPSEESMSIWPIIIAIVLSSFLVMALTTVMIKTKFLNRFKKRQELT